MKKQKKKKMVFLVILFEKLFFSALIMFTAEHTRFISAVMILTYAALIMTVLILYPKVSFSHKDSKASEQSEVKK